MQGHLGAGADVLEFMDGRTDGCLIAEVLELTFYAPQTVTFWVPDSGAVRPAAPGHLGAEADILDSVDILPDSAAARRATAG